MDDLETLLRKEFDAAARSVPDSPDPWPVWRRGLARRRAVLVGAAAAALLVAVAIVVPLSRHPAPTVPVGAPSPTDARPTQVFDHRHPLLLAEAGNDKAWVTMVGDRVVCIAMTKGEAAVDPQKEDCEPDATDDSSGHHPVRTRAIGSPDGPFGHLLLFVVDQGVHDLSVQRGDGTAATLRLLGTTRQRQFWLADFDGSTQGFGYDGIDAKGNHFSAIT